METVLEINLTALEDNLNYLRSKLAPDTLFLAVVKAFAYGNDSQTIARFLESCGVDYFAVAYANEGVALRDAGITTPIMVLHPQASNLNTLIDRCLEPCLYSKFILEKFVSVAKKKNQKRYPVHINFNTGLNRLGFVENDLDYLTQLLKNTPEIYAKSLFSHLAASEDLEEKDFTQHQIKSFKSISAKFSEQNKVTPMLHLANTSGILNYPEAHLNMVRSGIGMYGFGNDPEFDNYLKPIATLKTGISQIHHLKKGDSLGYNRAFVASKDMKTATLPLGHADGIGRQYGNKKGFVTINGTKAYIIGNVCMDMLMIDITDINCVEGDEVIVFGPQNTADALAATANTISYEIITAISHRVKRVFSKD